VARRYLARHFDEAYVDRISIGFHGAKIRKLALSAKSIDVRVVDFDVKWSLRDLILLHELKISDMYADKVFINYTRAEAAAKSGPKVPITGKGEYKDLQERLSKFQSVIEFVKSPKFPLKTTIDHMKVNGLLSIDEYIIAEISLDGSGFAPLSAAIVDIKSDVAIGETTPMRLNFNGKAKIFQSSNASIEDIDFDCDCKLLDPTQQSRKTFNITSLYKVTPSESLYRLHIGNDERTSVLCNAEIKYQKDQQKLFIECEKLLDLTMFGASILPQIVFDTRWSGEFEFQNWNGLLKGNGSCILGKNFIKTYLPSLKPDVSISGGIVLKMVNGTLVINSMETTCGDKDASWKIALFATNPVVIWNKDAGYLASKNIFNSGKSLCRVTVEKFNPKVFSTAKSADKIDTIISGQFDISSVDGCWNIKSSEKSLLKFDALTITQNSKKHIENVNVTCQAALNLGNTVQLTFSDIAVNETNGDEIAAGTVSFSFADNKRLNALDCYLVCRLDQLAQISWLAAGTPIKSGICSGHINFTQTSDSTAVQGNLNLKSFMLDDNSVPISGQCVVDFTHSNDDIKSNMELDISGQNDTSVFLTTNTFYENNTLDKPTLKFDLRGDTLSIPDLINLAKVPIGIFSTFSTNRNTLSTKTKTIASAIEQNDASVQQEPKSSLFKWIKKWLKGKGECLVSIKKLFFSDEGALDNVECLCYMTHDRVDLKTINFLLAESPFDLKATLKYFQDKIQDPYDFTLTSTFLMKDIGKICEGIKPSGEAVMEGTGRIDIQLASTGNDEWTTIRSGEGTIDISCSNGVLHLANFLNQKNRAILNAFEFSSGILSQANDHVANANFLMEEFQRLCYDSIRISIYRNKDLDILMKELNIFGPTIHVNASGSIAHARHKYFYNSPLSIDVKIGAAGKMGEIFDRLGLIASKPKNSQYMQGPRFNIRGTLVDPDFSDFTRILYPLF
jgi:hypothetical protein